MKQQPTAANDRQAYDHYHAHYDNKAYVRIQYSVIRDVFGEETADHPTRLWQALAQEPAYTLMNAVTDAALQIAGVAKYCHALDRLTILALQHDLSDDTLQRIVAHLHGFERLGDTHAEDFHATVQTIRAAQTAMDALTNAIRSASDIHSRKGRSAYHLLTAANALAQSATILLKEGDTGYLREKLARAKDGFKDAVSKLKGR